MADTKQFEFPCGCAFDILEDNQSGEFSLIDFNPDTEYMDLECPATWDLISDGNTKGVFQLESRLGKKLSKELKPRSIENLAALVSIMRPGCLEAKREGKSVTQHFIDRKNGHEEVGYFHSALKTVLEMTYGEMVYQEQAMQIAQKVAGFDLQQADVLRKAIGKKLSELMKEVKELFITGCANASILTKEEAEEVFSWIEKSQRYSFNKSHAVSYAMNAYMSAYAKAHFKRAFFTSYLFHSKTQQKPQEEVYELINNCRAMDVGVGPPDFRIMNKEFEIWKGNIHFGLFNIKKIGMAIVEKLEKQAADSESRLGILRDNWTWTTFLVHFSPNVTSVAVKNMIKSGAVEYFGVSRTKMLFEYEMYSKLSGREKTWVTKNFKTQHPKCSLENILRDVAESKSGKDGATANVNRKKKVHEVLAMVQYPPSSLDDSEEWTASVEEELLGIPLTKSVVDSCNMDAANTTCLQVENRTEDQYNQLMFIGCKIDEAKVITTKKGKGDKMAFLNVSDNTAQIDGVVCFPKEWQKYKSLCTEDNTIMLIGKRNKESLIVSKILQLTP
jgi:DNA polymerase-3 subunit alpha